MHANTTKPTHVSTDKLFEDLGFSKEQATVLELKLSLHNEIMKVVQKQKLTSRQLEKLLERHPVPGQRVAQRKNLPDDRRQAHQVPLPPWSSSQVTTTRGKPHGTEVA